MADSPQHARRAKDPARDQHPQRAAAPRRRPHLVAAGHRLPDLPAQLRRRERRRDRRPARHHLARALLAEARRRRRLAQPLLPVGPGRRRVRRRRLPRRGPAHRHVGRVRPDGRGAARRRHPRDRRHRAQPLLRPARLVPAGAGRGARQPRAAAVHLPRRPGSRRLAAAGRLDQHLRRAVLDARARRPVVPAPVRQGAAGLQLGQPRGPRGLPPDPAVLVGPGRGRVPHRRGARPDQGPRGEPAVAGRAGRHHRARRAPPVGPRRGARDLRGVAQGLRRVHASAHRRGRGLGRHASPAPVRERRRPGAGVQLRPAGGRLRRGPVHEDHR